MTSRTIRERGPGPRHIPPVNGAGQEEEARRLLADTLKHPQQSDTDIAGAYFRLGENEEGWKWLEKVYDERSYYMTWLKVSPDYDNIRSDPGFQAMLKKVGFE